MINMDEVEVRLKAWVMMRELVPNISEKEKGKSFLSVDEAFVYADQIAAWLMSGKFPNPE